jgi:hypothetical protein
VNQTTSLTSPIYYFQINATSTSATSPIQTFQYSNTINIDLYRDQRLLQLIQLDRMPWHNQMMDEPEVRRPEPIVRAPLNHELARAKAKSLLLENLSIEQREMYERHGFFEIEAHSRRRYRIHCNSVVANIYRLDDGGRFCAHCDSNLPYEDHFLAQKLMIEYEEETFLRIANRHR